MAWTLFASLLNPKLPDLDTNLSTLVNLGIIPCSISGTNTLLGSPLSPNQPPLNSYANNQAFVGRAGAGNTAATTFQYQSLTQLNVYKDTASGPAVLSGTEISQNMMLMFVYDSTLNGGLGGVHLINPIQTGSTGGGGGGGGGGSTSTITIGASAGAPGLRSTLKIVRASATTLTITARAIGVSDAAMTTYFNMSNVNLTLNGATVGANGLSTDVTGGVLGNDTFYYVYAIYAPSTATQACLLSSSSTAPTLPSGYTYFARIGSCRTNGSAQFLNYVQYNDNIQYIVDGTNPVNYPLIGQTTSASLTGGSLSLVSVTPPTAAAVQVAVAMSTSSRAAVSGNTITSADISLTNPSPLGARSDGALGFFGGRILLESTAIYAATNAGSIMVYGVGYTDNL